MAPMISHFFKFSFRGMKNHPGYSFITIFGLSIGLATVLLILIYVNDERSYDGFYKDADKIYRVVSTIDMGGQVVHTAFSPNALPGAVTQGYPQVEYIARASLSGKDKTIASRDKEVFATELVADAAFFKIFSYQFVEGDRNDPLPNTKPGTETFWRIGKCRKIFGASFASLFYSSTMGHLKLVLFAAVIAAPIGYYFSDKWLNSFAYHTPLSSLPFLLGGVLAGLLHLSLSGPKP